MDRKKLQKKQIDKLEMDEDGISVPNWLLEVLAWISRIEMANSKLSFSCKLFKQLCFPKLHENVKPHKIKQLEFAKDWRNNFGYLRVNCSNKQLPTPIVPPPSYILGFIFIRINFLDTQLLEFVQNILPRLNKIKFSVEMHFYQWTLEDRKTKVFRRLLDLLADKIVKFIFNHYHVRVSEFNQLFPGLIQKVNFLCARTIPEEFDILFDWLALPPINNEEKQQKILEFKQLFTNQSVKFIDRIKEEFSNANEPLNFFIIFPNALHLAYFSMENEKTGEILSLYRAVGWRNYVINLMVRCPKDEEDYWKEEGQRKITKSWDHEDGNETYIKAEIRD